MTELRSDIQILCTGLKDAEPLLAIADTQTKNLVLQRMADLAESQRKQIQLENEKDLQAGKNAGLGHAMLDRLMLNDKRISAMIKGLGEVADLADPVGQRFGERIRPNGLRIAKVRVPIGVILMIYESRPNVTVDSSALCLKSGNCVILRGGKEAIHSNLVLAKLFQRALEESGLPPTCVQFVKTTDHAAVDLLLQQNKFINLVIPRGGEGLIRTVTDKSRIPVIKHYKGVCHVYIDVEADLEGAKNIALNAKIQRPGVCNAMETLLLHQDLPRNFVKDLVLTFIDQGVELRGDNRLCKVDPRVKSAREEDWLAEYLELVLAVKTVKDMHEAVAHIRRYGSNHTEAIVTQNQDTADLFVRHVDSSSVMVNASTRFSDGGEYGLGAEIGISTDKLHARGPMGLEELTTYKWVVHGTGQVRE